MNNEEKDMTFHSENVVSRIAMWSNIMAFVILVFAMISLAYNLYGIIANWSQVLPGLPSNFIERAALFISKVFTEPVVGVFYFLVLRGMAQLLYIGLDLFYSTELDEEEEEEVETQPA